MKAAYLSVLDPSLIDLNDQAKLDAVIRADPSYATNPGWIETGRKWDVPKHAWRIGRCGKTYVWVMPDHAEDFSRFVLLTRNLASLQTTGKSPQAQVHVAPLTPSVAAPATDPFPPRLFDHPPSVNPGLFYVPRASAP
jgi:hypothetical protein